MKKLLALLLLLIAAPAWALGPYPGDQFVVDGQGNGLAAITVTVYLAGTTTEADIYSDNGITAIANPMTTDYRGHFMFWAANGSYDVCYSGSGVEPWCDLAVKIIDTEHVGAASFNVTDNRFGAVANDGIDDTAAIQAAITAAAALSPDAPVFFPAGQFDVYDTITFSTTPLIGTGLGSELVSHITDGSAVLEDVASGQQRLHLEDISIVNSDPNTVGNWIGVNIDANRSFMKNVRVRRAATGFRVSGFIHDFVNLWAYYCTTGFHADEFNANRVNINTEVCTTGVIIEDGSGIWITGVCEDNGTGLVMDGATAATVDMYFEGNSVASILMGQTTLCKGITLNCTIADAAASGVVPSIFDNVDGLDMTGTRVSSYTGIHLTENCINVVNLPITTVSAYDPDGTMTYPRNIKGASGFGTIENLFLNPYLRTALRGYTNVTKGAPSVTSIDTVNMLKGGGLRITADGDAGNSVVQIELSSAIGAYLAGKVVLVGGWVYIPDDDTAFPNDLADPECLPGIFLDEYYGATWNTQTNPVQTWTNDGWSFFCTQVAINAATTNVRVDLYQDRGGTIGDVPAGTITTFSGVFLVEAPANIQDLMMGRWTTHPLAGREFGSNLEWPGTAGPTDADQTYAVGDRVINTAFTANPTYLDYLCLVAGVGGTANQWKYRQITLEP